MARRLIARSVASMLLVVSLAGCAASVGAHSSPSPVPPSDDPCADVSVPDGADCVGGFRGDLDGDGASDTFVAWVRGGRPATWGARASVGGRTLDSAGGTVAAPDILPLVIGAADANGDGGHEAFVIADRGASTVFLHLFMVTENELVPVRFAGDDHPARLAVAGSVTHGNGVRCRPDGRLELLGAGANRAGTRHRWERTVYDWKADTIVQRERTTGWIRANDPGLSVFYELDCGGLDATL